MTEEAKGGVSGMNRKNPLPTDLYCITAEDYSLGRNNIEIVKQWIAAGIKVIQYREKDKDMKKKYEECKIIRELTKEAGVMFIVNDDVDLAMMVQADGVHIGQDDFPLEAVRQLVGDQMIIGISTHSPEQAQGAVKSGADYIGVGPIFKTSTKKNVCDPVGLEYLKYVVDNMSIPFVAIGGIKESNVIEVVHCGAKCIAMVTEITQAQDIGKKINGIRKIIKGMEEKE
jgi:thiamine-phosphate pyrophosphorylase